MPDTTVYINALGRSANLLTKVRSCMAEKYNSDNTYTPNTGKFNALRAGFITLLTQINHGVTQESFNTAIDQHIAAPLAAFIAADSLACSADDIVTHAQSPFPDDLDPVLHPNP